MVKEYQDKTEYRFENNLTELRDHVEFMDDSLLKAGEISGKKIAFAFGATGFNAAQSFGPIVDDLKAKGIPQVHIAGPAGLLGYSVKIRGKKKHIKIPLALRVHGHGKKPGFPLISGWHCAKDYVLGTGRGGIKYNVMLADAVINQLEVAEKINKETEIEILGWSRGGTAALLFARALIEKGYKVNCAAFDPVRGGFDSGMNPQSPALPERNPGEDDAAYNLHCLSKKLDAQLQSHEIAFPEKMHDSKITLFNSTATRLAYFANNRVKSRKVTEVGDGDVDKKGVIENKFLATTHDGAAYPFRRFGSKLFSRYARNEVNKLFGVKKSSDEIEEELKNLEGRRIDSNGSDKYYQKLKRTLKRDRQDQKDVDAKQLRLLLRQAKTILSLARDIKANPNVMPKKLKREAQIGRLPNYAASCRDLRERYNASEELTGLMHRRVLGRFRYGRSALKNILLENQDIDALAKKNGPVEIEPRDLFEFLDDLEKAATALDCHVRGIKIHDNGIQGRVEVQYSGDQKMKSFAFIRATLAESTPQLVVDTIGSKAVHLAVVDIPSKAKHAAVSVPKAAVQTVYGSLFASHKPEEIPVVEESNKKEFDPVGKPIAEVPGDRTEEQFDDESDPDSPKISPDINPEELLRMMEDPAEPSQP